MYMPGSSQQGRDSIYELVEEEEISDILEYSHREGFTGRDIIYRDDSMTEWLSAEYSIDVQDFR